MLSSPPSLTQVAKGTEADSRTRAEAELAAAKYKFMEMNKSLAEKKWDAKQGAKAKVAIAKEDAQIASDMERAVKAAKEEEADKKTAVRKVKEQLRKAQRKAAKEAKEAGEAAEGLKAKAETVAEGLKAKAEEIKEPEMAEEGENGTVYNIGSGGRSEFKSFEYHMDSDGSAFSASSAQYALQQKAYTGKYGIRMVDGRYCIAVGYRFCDRIGTKIDVVLEDGRRIKCIMGDAKARKDTDDTESYHLVDGSYVEFIVDRGSLNWEIQEAGNVGVIDEFAGRISQIIVYG